MNLQDWREQKAQSKAFTLPSGLEIQVRTVKVLDLAMQGKIPQTLMPLIAQGMDGGKITLTLENISQIAELAYVICRACVVGPEGLDVAELDYEDANSVVELVSEVTAGLQTFRGEPERVVGTGRNGAEVRAEAEQFHRLEG